MKKNYLFSAKSSVNAGRGYTPSDIRSAYHIPSHLDGTGQTLGILEFSSGYNLQDAHQFWNSHSITPPSVRFVSVGGAQNDGGSQPQDIEASIDLQWAGAIAPGAKFVVYEADAGHTFRSFTQAMIKTLRYILNDTNHHPSVISISYGDGETSFGRQSLTTIANLIKQLDAKGVTVCVSSGDQGAYGLHNPYRARIRHADAPATAPHAVAVGGTTLHRNGSETAWTYKTPRDRGATGGGFSHVFSAPLFQRKLQMQRQDKGRGIPDVALNADPDTGYEFVFQGQPGIVGGTSVSAPVFAAIVALANQKRAQSGLNPLKGLTKTLYQRSSSLPYNDITVGNNSYNGVVGYQAKAGWDACTGWGSVNAAAFIDALSGKPT